jgi:hypothetical protein
VAEITEMYEADRGEQNIVLLKHMDFDTVMQYPVENDKTKHNLVELEIIHFVTPFKAAFFGT